MRKRPLIAIMMALVLGITQIPSVCAPDTASSAATTPSLSAKKLTVRVGSKKTLKVKNTSYKVTFSVASGSVRIKLVSKKKKQVSIKGVKTGTAKVKAKVRVSSKKYKTLTCKITIKPAIWICPTCGQKNDTNYCANCGTKKPSSELISATATPSPTPEPTVAPVGPDALSQRMIWMQINDGYYVGLKMYANDAATDFYNRVAAGTIGELYMAPSLDKNERVVYMELPMSEYVSASRKMNAGDLFLYGQYVLKFAVTDYVSDAYPTRLAKISDSVYLSSVGDGVKADKQGLTKVRFLTHI